MPQARVEWDYNADNYLEIGTEEGDALYNVLTSEYPEDATVTYTLKDRLGANVTGYVDQAMAHVSGTTGSTTKYRVSVQKTATPLPVGHYTAVVTATKAGVDGQKFTPITVRRG